MRRGKVICLAHNRDVDIFTQWNVFINPAGRWEPKFLFKGKVHWMTGIACRSWRMAAFLEENDLFIPEDENDE